MNLRVFTNGGISDFEAKNRGVNSVSGDRLHDFEIICPAKGCICSPRTFPAYGLAIPVQNSLAFSNPALSNVQ